MIRQQQAQIQALQTHNPPHSSSAVAVDDSTPTSERSMPLNHPTTSSQPIPVQPSSASRPRSPFVAHSLSRQSSYRSSRNASPSLHPTSGHIGVTGEGNDLSLGPSATRDESAFYQAETQNLTRENQMLKLRIRELGE
jgi:hypothetical protein